MAENFRKKLFKPGTPLGQKDPYARLTPEQKLQEEQEALALAEAEQKKESLPDLPDQTQPQDANAAGYVPATTWDGLDQIGGATGWWEEAWDKENQFKGSVALHSTVQKRC